MQSFKFQSQSTKYMVNVTEVEKYSRLGSLDLHSRLPQVTLRCVAWGFFVEQPTHFREIGGGGGGGGVEKSRS